jgi:hypothetical protein
MFLQSTAVPRRVASSGVAASSAASDERVSLSAVYDFAGDGETVAAAASTQEAAAGYSSNPIARENSRFSLTKR